MRHIAGWKFSIRCVTESLRRQENFRKNFRFLSARYKTTFWRCPSIILYTRSREEVVGFLCRNIISLISIRLHRRSCIFFVKCMRNLLADERKSCAGSYESTDRISWNFESFCYSIGAKKDRQNRKRTAIVQGLYATITTWNEAKNSSGFIHKISSGQEKFCEHFRTIS